MKNSIDNNNLRILKDEEGDKNLINSSSIIYKGSVVIKHKRKNGKETIIARKNTGKAGLFNFLLYSLQGNPTTASMYFPARLLAFYQDTSGTFVRNLSQTVSTKGTNFIDWNSDPPNITYCFEIPRNIIISNQPIQKIQLLSSNYDIDNPTSDYICAEIDLTSSPIEIKDEGSIIIYWTLSFSNSSK